MAVSQILHRVPTSLWRGLFPKSELGFCYHMVSDVPLPHLRHYPILSPAEFDADLTYLRRYFDFISYEQLVQRRESSNLARDNSVILTFDDGFAECATVAAPILLRHGAGCVFFVVTDLIDNSMVFRESEASLCIDAICRLPIERVEAVVFGLPVPQRHQGVLEDLPQVGDRLGESRMSADALDHLEFLTQVAQISPNALTQAGEHRLRRIVDAHHVARASKHLRNAVAHEAGADYCDRCTQCHNSACGVTAVSVENVPGVKIRGTRSEE